MAVYKISGNKELFGTVEISAAKNAVLPVIFCSILTSECLVIENVPLISDVICALEIISELGGSYDWAGDTLKICGGTMHASRITEPAERMRASILCLGPMLARFGSVQLALPGGCRIGARPVDLHIKGLSAMGAEIKIEQGILKASADGLKGGEICLDFPSVGATENLIMASCLADGETVIVNAAQEPEVCDLARLLIKMGADIRGAGEDTLYIKGTAGLHGTRHTPIPDRIEAGTFMTCAAACGGEVRLKRLCPAHLKAVSSKLVECGAIITELEDELIIRREGELKAADVRSLPYPGFPTDLQSQFAALACSAKGTSVIVDTVFEGRNNHVPELLRMGADIMQQEQATIVRGGGLLGGAAVNAPDLRAGAALIIAGLSAKEGAIVEDCGHIDRGYYRLCEKLKAIGAEIERLEEGEQGSSKQGRGGVGGRRPPGRA